MKASPKAFLNIIPRAADEESAPRLDVLDELPAYRLLVKNIIGTWHCSLFVTAADRARLNKFDTAGLEQAARSGGVFAVIEALEWELSAEEFSDLDRFDKRGEIVILPDVSDAALDLATMDGAVGMELNLSRSPVFTPSRGDDMQLALSNPTIVGSLHNAPFSITAPAGWLTVRDGMILSELIKMYVDQGFPESRAVTATVSDICEAAGYAEKGGWQFERVTHSLMRLRSASFSNVVRLEDGNEEAYV